MGTQIQISIAEYLHTAYRPDREYVDGEVRERNVGKWEHARIQWLLASWFASNESAWGVMGSTEQRLKVTANSVRIPDLVIVESGPQPEVLTHPPLLVIEILSPDDTYSGLEDRVHDYQTMGTKNIWLVDPVARVGRTRIGDSWSAATMRLTVENSPINVELNDIFKFLDRPR